MSLCTLEQLKLSLGIGAADVEHDAALTALVARVSASLARAAGRPGRLELTTAVDTFGSERRTEVLWLRGWPVVEVTEVVESVIGLFDEGSVLAAGYQYQIRTDLGLLYRVGLYWPAGMATVRVTGSGGYTPPDVSEADGYVPGAGEILLPVDITEAAVLQASFWWSRRDSLGVRSISTGGGASTTYARDELLPIVRETMASYARMMG